MASDIPNKWYPKTLPLDQQAAARLGAWVTAATSAALEATGLDLRGANLSGGNFNGASFSHAVLAGVSLAGADLRRTHLEKADLVGANLLGADLRGADLSEARVAETSFKVRVDDHTVVRGMSGTLSGPVTLVTGDSEQELDGAGLQRWLTGNGAEAEVLSGFTYYAKLRTGFSRENPSGIVRRSSVDGIDYDEAFTRNLRWEPTEYLRLYELGHNEIDHVEITRAEAEAFVARIKETLGSPSQES